MGYAVVYFSRRSLGNHLHRINLAQRQMIELRLDAVDLLRLCSLLRGCTLEVWQQGYETVLTLVDEVEDVHLVLVWPSAG